MEHIRLKWLLVGLALLMLAHNAAAQTTATIQLVHDQQQNPLDELVIRELTILAEGRFDLTFVEYGLDQKGQADIPDLLIALGPVAGQQVLINRPTDIPVIIGAVLDPVLQGLELTEDGTSGIENLNYVLTPFDAGADLAYFRRIYPYQHLAILIDKNLAMLASGMTERLATLVGPDAVFSLVPVESTDPEVILNSLPESCDAVYVLPLGPAISPTQLSELFGAISDAGLPSFALFGSSWVELGVLASRAPRQSDQTLARRVALNALNILSGEAAADQPVRTSLIGEDFVINMETVRRSGVYPGWQVLGEARLINLTPMPEGVPVHLRGVIDMALTNNLEYEISQLQTQSNQQNIPLALSELLPELSLGSTFSAIDQKRSAASFGGTQPYTWAASADMSQVLFAEPLYANLRIQKLLQASQVASQDQTELDVVLTASESYFNILLAHSVVELQNKNVENTRINLNLARNKEEAGYSGISDVYRWESQLAFNKIDLNDAVANLNSARFRLNQVLNLPQSSPIALSDAELGDSLLSILDARLFSSLSDPGQLDQLADFLVEESRRNLPELAQVNLSIQAQERLLQSRNRAFYLPTLGLNAQTGINLYQGGYESTTAIPPEFQTLFPEPITGLTWSAGVGVNLPVFQGGERNANVQQATVDLARIQAQQKDLENQLELRIRSAMQSAGASFAEIGLSRHASSLAKKNLEIAQNGYREGFVPIAQLIDAQEAALQAEILASNAVYSFLLDFLTVERAIGFYYFLATPEEQAVFFERAQVFLK